MKRCRAGSNPRFLQKNFRNYFCQQEIISNGSASSPEQRFPSLALDRLGPRRFSYSMATALKSVPRHIAIIMGGNGRWAKARGLPRIKGHEEGAKAARQCVEG